LLPLLYYYLPPFLLTPHTSPLLPIQFSCCCCYIPTAPASSFPRHTPGDLLHSLTRHPFFAGLETITSYCKFPLRASSDPQHRRRKLIGLQNRSSSFYHRIWENNERRHNNHKTTHLAATAVFGFRILPSLLASRLHPTLLREAPVLRITSQWENSTPTEMFGTTTSSRSRLRLPIEVCIPLYCGVVRKLANSL